MHAPSCTCPVMISLRKLLVQTWSWSFWISVVSNSKNFSTKGSMSEFYPTFLFSSVRIYNGRKFCCIYFYWIFVGIVMIFLEIIYWFWMRRIIILRDECWIFSPALYQFLYEFVQKEILLDLFSLEYFLCWEMSGIHFSVR